MEASSNSESPSTQTPLPPKKRRRGLRIILISFCVLLLLVLLTPFALSLGYLRSKVQSEVSNNLRGKCEVADVSFSWFSGVAVNDLRIENPPGWPTERPAVVMKAMSADVSIISLLFGTVLANAEIDGLEVNVEQKADGTTNLQELQKPSDKPAEAPKPTEPKEEGGTKGADGLGFDFKLKDCAVTIRREGKVLEKLSGFSCIAVSKADSSNINIDADGKLLGGDLKVKVLVDPSADTTDAQLVTHGLDLNSWRPLIDAFMPDQLTALTGKVNGDITATMRGGDKVQLAGELIIDGPRLAGPILQGMDMQSAQWKITPAIALGGKSASDIDASKFKIDLDWLHITGRPSTAPGQVTLAYDLDLAKLAEFGGPIPEMLKGSGSMLDGVISLPSNDLPKDAEGWVNALITNADLQVKALDVAGFALRDVGLNVNMKDGALTIATTESTKLDGGALLIGIDVDLKNLATMPLSASVNWQGGKLTGGATQTLRYVMPLFAGLDANAARIVGDVNLDFKVGGPAMMKKGDTLLGWLDSWTGNGSLGLANTAFAPSKQLEGLLAPLGPLTKNAVPVGDDGRLKIDGFKAPFSFSKGVVTSTSSEWNAAGQKIGLAGTVGFDGKMDYSVDFTSLLKGHKNGEQVLKALNGQLPPARLNGSIDDPKLGLPELGNIAKTLIEQEGKDLLNKGLQKGLKGLFGK
tara:strand:+ start:102476 stop:104557 length:2082 start_codon:yes stop_codon:yes gene_type:complete